MTEYSRIARGSFTTAASPVRQYVYLPFQPTHVTLTNTTAYSTPAQYATTRAYWDIALGQDVADVEYISASSFPWNVAADYIPSVASGPTYQGGGIFTFSAGTALLFGPQVAISGIVKATTVITTTTNHGFSVGDVVMFQGLAQSSTTGMNQIAGIPFTVATVPTATTFTITWNLNQSNYTALSGSPAGAYVKKVLNPYLYLPGYNIIEAINTTSGLITTTTNHNYVVGQQVAFRIPSAWGSTQLNSLPDSAIPGQPIYYYISAVNSNTTFTIANIPSGVSAYNSNQPFASVPGLQFPQVIAVGDVNSGGWPYTGGALYPSPSFPTSSGGVPTINGPAVQGAFVNNTRQGFGIGLGYAAAASASATAATAPLLAASSTYIWEATYFDIG